jgi:hypothetical protein
MAQEISPHTTHTHIQRNLNLSLEFYAVFLLLLLLGIDIYVFIFLRQISWLVWLATACVYLSTIVVNKFLKIQEKDTNSWFKGDSGENQVKEILYKLPNEYRYLGDVLIDHKPPNIDFVAIGPTGIYAIEVKNVQPGWNGLLSRFYYYRFSKQTYFEAMRLKNYLYKTCGIKFYIKAVLVLADPSFDKWGKTTKSRNIDVVSLPLLTNYILKQPIINYDQAKVIRALENI